MINGDGLTPRRAPLMGAVAILLMQTAAALAQGMPPAAVELDTVTLKRLAPMVDVPGTVISRFDARLATELSATVNWIAEVGTRVEEDEVVARLESATFRLDRRQAESRVQREQARVEFLRSERARLVQLSQQNLSAKRQLDQTISDLAVAEGDLAIAEAQRGLAEIAVRRTEIRAPFAGVVTERLRNLGERLNVADELLRLVDPDSLEIVARAPLSSVNFIQADNELAVHNDYRDATAQVRTVVPFGNPESHMFEVRLRADAALWTVGESVRVSMPIAQAEEVLAIPRDALILRREGASVFKVGRDKTVQRVSVITGLGSGSDIQVSGNLEPGDQIVVRGGERLADGMTVNPGGGAAGPAQSATKR